MRRSPITYTLPFLAWVRYWPTPFALSHNTKCNRVLHENALEIAMARGQIQLFDFGRAIYYTGRETIISSGRRLGLPRWREEMFALMHHNAQRPGAYFKIPSAQTTTNRGRTNRL
jgi:K+ transporter